MASGNKNSNQPSAHINDRGYWKSNLFSEIFLKVDVPQIYRSIWDNDGPNGLADFQQCLLDLVEELSSAKPSHWSETDTVNNIIKPVMEFLGWHGREGSKQDPIISELSLLSHEGEKKKTYRPDLLYVHKYQYRDGISKAKNTDRLLEARHPETGAIMVLEAKYWDRLQEYNNGDTKGISKKNDRQGDDGTRSLPPNDQILKYMDLLGRDFGILTDGKTWRLFHNELSRGDLHRYFEFDLGNLMDLARIGLDNSEQRRREFEENIKYFYYLFCKESLCKNVSDHPLVYKFLDHSRTYAERLEEDLKERFVMTMGHICNGMVEDLQKKKKNVDLDLIRKVAESHLFNILFIRSCEIRGILPLKAPAYLSKSITDIVSTLDGIRFEPGKLKIGAFEISLKRAWGEDFELTGSDLYERLLGLYEVVNKGTKLQNNFGFEIDGFNESVFTPDELKLAKSVSISNEYMLRAMFCLSFVEVRLLDKLYQQLPYNFITPRQLGSIYESFLEYSLQEAESDLIFQNGDWKSANLDSKKVRDMDLDPDRMVRKGKVYFSCDNSAKKSSGSYYTPEYIVRHIVENSLLNIGKSSNDILKFRICDPAMGSGHFLTASLDVLSVLYRQRLSDELNDDLDESREETMRRILDHCIFGVDLNPSAVKLAKLSLWLQTAFPGKKLECLDDQLKCGDSLVNTLKGYKSNFDWNAEFRGQKFDAIVGNPPWHDIKGMPKNLVEYYFKNFKTAENRINIFGIFMEQSITLLNDRGVLGLITPASLLVQSSYTRLRKHLFETTNPTLFVKLPDRTFKGVTAETAISVWKKGEAKATKVVVFEADQIIKSIDEKLAFHVRDESSDVWKKAVGCIIGVATDNAELALVEKIEKDCITLDSIGEFCLGLTPYDKYRGHTEDQIKNRVFHSNKKVDASYKKLISGGDINRYYVKWESGEWISYGEWLGAPRNPKFFKGPRIIFRQIVSGKPGRIYAGYTEEELYHAQVGFSFLLKQDSNWSIKFVLGLVNSKLLTFYHLAKYLDRTKTTFQKLLIQNAKRFPVPLVKDPTKKKLMTRIESAVSKVIAGEEAAKNESEIDECMFDLFGLTSEERKLVEKYFEAAASKGAKGMQAA